MKWIENNLIDDEFAGWIAEMLKTNNGLKGLSLGFFLIIKFLFLLKKIILYWILKGFNPIQKIGGECICEALIENESLYFINLGFCTKILIYYPIFLFF